MKKLKLATADLGNYTRGRRKGDVKFERMKSAGVLQSPAKRRKNSLLEDTMQVVSVINYKGGVGKTTLTANLGAKLAQQGKKILLLDMDAQCSLTFSFIKPDRWEKELMEKKTIKRWFDGISEETDTIPSLTDLVERRLMVNERLGGKGVLDLIPSHLGLINVDLNLATLLGGANVEQTKRRYVKIHGKLREHLHKFAREGGYDLVLIDCPPNFNIVTKSAIISSDGILIPAKPDYLSTLGIDYLVRSQGELVDQFREYSETQEVAPKLLGVVFTMIQIHGGVPIAAQRQFISRTAQLGHVSLFDCWVRENKSIFADAPEDGIPVVLQPYSRSPYTEIVQEIESFVDEFSRKAGM